MDGYYYYDSQHKNKASFRVLRQEFKNDIKREGRGAAYIRYFLFRVANRHTTVSDETSEKKGHIKEKRIENCIPVTYSCLWRVHILSDDVLLHAYGKASKRHFFQQKMKS